MNSDDDDFFNMSELFIYSFNMLTCFNNIDQLKLDLSVSELERAGRFKHEKNSRSYIVSHAMLRRVLARELMCDPLALVFEKNVHGKPFLVDNPIFFNLSHSGDYGLIALSHVAPVGVDIEKHNPKTDILGIAKRYFTSDEYLYIKHRSEREQFVAFYEIWSAKEAYVKALGEGISHGFNRFSVINSGGDFVTSVEGLSLNKLAVDYGYSAAVVGYGAHVIYYLS